jgi:Fe-S-cluster containining protein
MQTWEKLLDIRWPEAACDQSGECCRGAAQYQPWQALFRQAAQGDATARNFLNQYQPYPTRLLAETEAPHAVETSLAVIHDRNQNPDDVIFYRCIYLKGKNECQIYEDRPALCRDFPESPFSAIPKCCGYASIQNACTQKAAQLKAELEHLKTLKAKLSSAFTDISP